MKDSLDDLRRQLNRVSTAANLRDIIERVVGAQGFEKFAYILFHGHMDRSHSADFPPFLTNYPTDWIRRYVTENYQLKDPVLIQGLKRRGPFRWGSGQMLKRLTRDQKKLMGEGKDFGIAHGITIPVHGPLGECGFMTVATQENTGEFERRVAESELKLQILAYHLHRPMTEKLLPNSVLSPGILTPREIEALYWTANGKTTWEISRILGRSESTVNFHIKHAITKIDATNKCHAAIKACKLGLLTL